jgi:1-acyl-sn-glycerol-3-phosphate acyltransferase
MRRALRITRLALHVARGLFIAALFFPFQGRERRRFEIQRWARQLLAIAAVRLHVHGAIADATPLMLVANHVSWLDIFAIQSICPVRFVAKTETRSWPLVGWLSERAGTLFIHQARLRDTHRINTLVADAMRAGDVFAFFPEGTTTDGSRLLKFHASLLAPALEADAAVQPVAIRYEREDGTLCTGAAFDGERSLMDTVMSITAEPHIDAHVWFAPTLQSAGRRRREVAEHAREIILRMLSSTRSERGAGLRASAR